MSENPIIPISDEQAKLGQEIVGAMRDAGKYLTDIMGDLPRDLVGLLAGDRIKARRAERIAEHWARVKKRLAEQGTTEPDSPPLKLALPILAEVADESDEDLKEIWARLFAASMQPGRSKLVRRRFIEAVKKLDPPDARVMTWMQQHGGGANKANRKDTANDLGVTHDEVDVSLINLVKAEFAFEVNPMLIALNAFGREFLRCISD